MLGFIALMLQCLYHHTCRIDFLTHMQELHWMPHIPPQHVQHRRDHVSAALTRYPHAMTLRQVSMGSTSPQCLQDNMVFTGCLSQHYIPPITETM